VTADRLPLAREPIWQDSLAARAMRAGWARRAAGGAGHARAPPLCVLAARQPVRGSAAPAVPM